ncbi:MAG: polymerase ECF-type sigma factor [Chloroflexi bacterium]|nr:polymerase ECF-type sigma factor [Chloroflexota bacterium]
MPGYSFAGCRTSAVAFQSALEASAFEAWAPGAPATNTRGKKWWMADDMRQPVPGDDTRASAATAETPASVGANALSAGGAAATHGSAAEYALLDDAELVERAKYESAAFGHLYERHVRSVFGFAYNKVQDASVAEDLTSQTFLRALKALPRYEQRGVPFRSWLFRITANLVADRHRSPHPEVPLRKHEGNDEVADEIDPPDPHAEEEITEWERAEAFARLIADLSPEQRTAVHLRFVDGLPIAAIATQMARSEGAVKMMLMRALQNLRRTMTLETSDAG